MARNLSRFYFYTVFITIRSLTTYWLIRSLAVKLLRAFAALCARSHHEYKQADGAKNLLLQNATDLQHIAANQPLERDRALAGYL